MPESILHAVVALIYNLALLVALSTVSGFIGDRLSQRLASLAQGLLFGTVAVIGMLNPLSFGQGLFFDGRSVVLSLCGLFFGPLATALAGGMALVCRVLQGGMGASTGVAVIIATSLLGVVFHYRWYPLEKTVTVRRLYGFGLLVHLVVLALMFLLPLATAIEVLKRIGLPILLIYPPATVLIGRILAHRLDRSRFVSALTESEAQLKEAQALAHLGSWEQEVGSDAMVWADETWRILGLPMQPGAASYTLFMTRVHEGDRPLVEEVYLGSQREGRDGYELEYRIVRPDGELRWIFERGRHFKDAAGRVCRSVGFIQDVTESKVGEMQRLELAELVRQRNEELERFIYTVSHDLKSPLVTFKTFLGFLRQDQRTGSLERMEKDLNFMEGAAVKMEKLLDGLLEMSRIGRLANAPVPVPFHELVEEARLAVAGAIAAGEVEVTMADAEVVLFGDRVRLGQIWQNLLDNAVKYRGEQTQLHIEIGAELLDGDWVFYLRDNGMGIAAENRNKIFGLFEKLDPHSPGSGLGLALVKRIVELYKGRIWVESAGLGSGCCFKFTLPEAVVPAPQEARS